jgi:hypothetical protein
MKVICLGSGKNMTLVNDWDTTGITIAGVNNVWKGTKKWNYLIHAGDYLLKNEIRKSPEQKVHSVNGPKGYRESYIAMSNPKGVLMPWEKARIHLGLPIYFTLTYWVLHNLKPTHIGFLGFDMNYTPGPNGETAFYGVGHDMKKRGIPDPLYQFRTIPEYAKEGDKMIDILMSRLNDRRGTTQFYNLSDDPDSVLPWERATFEEFKMME